MDQPSWLFVLLVRDKIVFMAMTTVVNGINCLLSVTHARKKYDRLFVPLINFWLNLINMSFPTIEAWKSPLAYLSLEPITTKKVL
jgi:hypothetical protein